MAAVEEALKAVCEKFRFKELNAYQKVAIEKFMQGRDIFVNLPTGYGKSLIFQALPTMFDMVMAGQGSIVVVVCPLLNLSKDQVAYLNSLGISAINISHVEKEGDRRDVEAGKYSLVYGTPESWLDNDRWRSMLTNKVYSEKLCAIAVDEAHVIRQWGTSSTNDHAVFRECYARLHEFRSLAPKEQIVALTATATNKTRDTIFDILLMKEPYVIFDSPNKPNLTYSIHYMEKEVDIVYYLGWLADDLRTNKEECARTIVYCQTIKQCGVIYATIRGLLGKDMFTPNDEAMLEMLHSCTPVANKNTIMESFSTEAGKIRVLVATIAFGMGVNCKAVSRVVHFGPAKNIESYAQETGRAGRDGSPAQAILLYNGLLLAHVEGNMTMYATSSECRRKGLMKHFEAEFTHISHLHLCCDICAMVCKCSLPSCGKSTEIPSYKTNANTARKTRQVSHEQKASVCQELNIYHKELVRNLLKTTSMCQINIFTDISFVLGFSELQIQQVLNNIESLFTVQDIYEYIEIWDLRHANKILQVLADTFNDTDENNLDKADIDDLMDDLWVEECMSLLDDDELLAKVTDVFLQDISMLQNMSLLKENLSNLEISDTSFAAVPDVVQNVLGNMDMN
ncbi:mediator of RNA polymerase II transcription subunit 34-like isoform X1 [Stylophora pistillata]|nr:mediator of RNA polymerase II transcription subunit 34-like isoform X1 [Stylophora pistillata]